MLTRGRGRVGLWAALAAALAIGGCASANPKAAGPVLLYRAPERWGVGLVAWQADPTRVYLRETGDPEGQASGQPPAFPTRYLRADPKGGRPKVLGRLTITGPSPAAVSADGRVAIAEWNSEDAFATEVKVLAGGRWETVIPLDGRARLGPVWSPDSQHLLYGRWRLSPEGVGPGVLVVAELPSSGRRASETEITPLFSARCYALWSRDGHTIYLDSEARDGAMQIATLSYPSAQRAIVQTAPWIGFMRVASHSGDLVWLASQSGKLPLQVWKMAPDGQPTATALTLSAAARDVAVSPDGDCLAIALKEGKSVVIGRLADGSTREVPGLAGKDLRGIRWTADGKSLVYSDGKAIWRVPAPEPGEPVPHSAPERGPRP